MKRVFSFLLIALLALALVPRSVSADIGDFSGGSDFGGGQQNRYILVGSSLLTPEAQAQLESRAAAICEARGVAVYFVYEPSAEDIIAFCDRFIAESVPEENALVLGVSRQYAFAVKGARAEAAFPPEVRKEKLKTAFESVTGNDEGKILAYLNAADDVLKAYTDSIRPPTVVDDEHLLTEAEAEALSKRLREIGDAYECDVIVATAPSLGGKSAEEYADDFFDYRGYGYGAIPDENGTTVDGSGVLLLISTEDRDFAVSTSGYGVTAFTDYGIQKYLEPLFWPLIHENRFAEGFNAFADGCEYLLKTARAGEPFDVYTVSEKTANGKPVFADMAGILEPDQVRNLSKKLRELGDKYRCDVILVTDVDAFADGDAFAAKYYADNGYGYRVTNDDGSTTDRGGILLFYSQGGGQISVYTEGYAKKVFTGRGLYKFRQSILSAHYGGDFTDVVNTYASESERYLESAKNGRVINPINPIPIVIAAVLGLLFGFIPVNAMKRQLTDVTGVKTNAEEYLEPASFVMTQNSDVLLGTNVSRTVHVVQSSSGGSSGGGRSGSGGGFHGGSSTHTSSSGGTHGGHSGKF